MTVRTDGPSMYLMTTALATTDHDTLRALAEATCAATNTRRDGIVWGHSVNVRAGKRCPTVIELQCCHSVKAWANKLAAELAASGLRVHVGKAIPRYIGGGYGCRGIPNGFEVWISVLGEANAA